MALRRTGRCSLLIKVVSIDQSMYRSLGVNVVYALQSPPNLVMSQKSYPWTTSFKKLGFLFFRLEIPRNTMNTCANQCLPYLYSDMGWSVYSDSIVMALKRSSRQTYSKTFKQRQ